MHDLHVTNLAAPYYTYTTTRGSSGCSAEPGDQQGGAASGAFSRASWPIVQHRYKRLFIGRTHPRLPTCRRAALVSHQCTRHVGILCMYVGT